MGPPMDSHDASLNAGAPRKRRSAISRMRFGRGAAILFGFSVLGVLGFMLSREEFWEVFADPPLPLEVVEIGSRRVEIYGERRDFERRLRRRTRLVDFDDVDTSSAGNVAFAADRYAKRLGIVISGQGGQYVDRSFEYPSQYVPVSAPNMYAPGPIGSKRLGVPGGCRSTVTFVSGGRPARVAGFGAVFIDPDYPGIAPSTIVLYDARGTILLRFQKIRGGNADRIFRGLVVTDAKGRPVPVVGKVEIVNGNEWPSYNSGEGVALDDFVFGIPVP